MFPLDRTAYLLSPRVTVLVTTTKGGKVRAAPFSWVFPVSFEPSMLAVGISKDNQGTLPNIKVSREFVVNIVSEEFGQQAIDCEEIRDLENVGLHTIKSEKIQTPGIKESKVRLECRLEKIFDTGGDHFLVCGRIVNASCQKAKKVGTKDLPDLDFIKPLLHVGGQEFRGVGKEIMLKRLRR